MTNWRNYEVRRKTPMGENEPSPKEQARINYLVAVDRAILRSDAEEMRRLIERGRGGNFPLAIARMEQAMKGMEWEKEAILSE